MSLQTIFLIVIFAIMLISITVGLIQGFRKSMYNLVATIMFWVIFWVSAPFVTGKLIFENESLFNLVGTILPPIEGASYSTLIEYIIAFMVDSFELDKAIFEDEAIAHNIIALAQCLIKIIYLIVLALVYWLIKVLVYHIFFKKAFKVNRRKLRKLKKKQNRYFEKRKEPNKKLSKQIDRMEKRLERKGRNTVLGMASGAARGLLTCALIMCVINSNINLIPKLIRNDVTASTEQNEETPINLYDFILQQTNNDPMVKAAVDMIADYQDSFLMKATGLKIGDKRADDLFIDSILSGKSEDYSFELRNEMASIIQIAEKAFYVTNGFNMESVNFAELSETQITYIQDILLILSDTDLLNNLGSVLVGTALSLDAVAPYMPENLSPEAYKNINWSNELKVIAQLVADVYGLGGNLTELNYLELDTEQVKKIFNTLSELDSINFLGHVASSYAFKSMVEEDPEYAAQLANIEETLADMAINGKFSEDVKAFGTLYETFSNIMSKADFDSYKDEDGKVTNYLAALTSIKTEDYQLYKDLVSNILETNFLTEIFPDVLVIVKDKLIAKDHPELAAMINPSITTTTQWENEINTVIDIISQLTEGENGEVVPFEGIENFTFKQLSNISVNTILQSEVLSYAMIKMLIDTSKGKSILTEDSSEITEMICVPEYLCIDAVEDENGIRRFHPNWYGKNGELDIMLSTLFNCMSSIDNIEYPVVSLPAMLQSIDTDLLTSSDVLYLSLNKLIENFRDFFVVPSSVMGDSIGKDTYKVDMPDIIKRDEIKKLLNVFTDENVLDLEQAYVYINLVEQPDGTIEEVVIDKSEKTEDTVVRLDMDNMLNLLMSEKLYDPNDPLEDGANIGKLFSSEILRASLTNIITDTAGEFIVIPENAVDTPQVCYLYEVNEETDEKTLIEKELGIIKVDQFKALIMAIRDLDINLDTITGEDPMVLINAFEATDSDGNTILNPKVEPIFDNESGINSKYSAILHATISKYVLDYSSGSDSIIKVPEAVIDNDGTLITGSEVVNLLNSVVILGSDILEGSVDDSIKDKLIEDIIETPAVLDSLIIRATLTSYVKAIEEVTIPTSALQEETLTDSKGYVAIKHEHIQELLDAVHVLKEETGADSYLDIFNVNTLTVGTLSDFADDISKSLILRATITTKLEDLENSSHIIVLPSTAYTDPNLSDSINEKFIKETEIESMFGSLKLLFGESGSVDSIDGMNNIEIAKVKDYITTISNSEILRATITSNLKLSLDGEDSPLFIEESGVDKAFNNDNQPIVILTATELTSIVDAMHTISSGGSLTFELSLNTLFKIAANSEVVLASSMIRIAVSDYLVKGFEVELPLLGSTKIDYSYVMPGDPIANATVIKLPSGEEEVRGVLSKDQILAFVNKLATMVPQE